MRLLQSLNRIRDRANRESRLSRSRRSQLIVSCESLETRALLSVLNITGSNLNVSLGVSSSGDLVVTENGRTRSYAPTEFTGVDVTATGGNNVVDVTGTLSYVPVTINLSAGTGMVTVGDNLSNIAYEGGVSVSGTSTADVLNINDQNDLSAVSYEVQDSTVTSSDSAGSIVYGGIGTLTLSGGNSPANAHVLPQDTYDIEGTVPSTVTHVVGGSAHNVFNVSGISNNLTDVGGPVSIVGGVGSSLPNATINFDDQAGNLYNPIGSQTYTITNSTVQRSGGGAAMGYSWISHINIYGGNAVDTYNIESTPPDATMQVVGYSGNDTFNISPMAKNLHNISGNLTVVGAGVGNKLNIYDQNNSGAVTYTLASSSVLSSSVTRTGAATISYASDGAVNLYGGSGNDTYDVNGTPYTTAVAITGGSGNDTFKLNSVGDITGKINGGGGTNTLDYSGYAGTTPVTVNLQTHTATGTGGFANIQKLVGSSSVTDTLVGANTTNTWSITANNGGTVNSFAFSGIGFLTGGTGMDVFDFSAGKTVTGSIDGGGGGDWLDYSAYTTAVTVDLSQKTATTATGTLIIANIQNVRGGQGADNLTGSSQGNILIGGAGTNTITGGAGKSILIGDKGKDSVTGKSDSDILIGGYTNYDSSSLANDMALESILTEWQSGDSYTTRISKIKSGVGPSASDKLVWSSTVHDNGTGNANTLTGAGGNSGLNWFFANVAHTTTNQTGAEQSN